MPPKKSVKYDAATHERILYILISEQDGFKPDYELIASKLGATPHTIREHFRTWKGKFHYNSGDDEDGAADDPQGPTPKRRKTTQPKTPRTPKTPKTPKIPKTPATAKSLKAPKDPKSTNAENIKIEDSLSEEQILEQPVQSLNNEELKFEDEYHEDLAA